MIPPITSTSTITRVAPIQLLGRSTSSGSPPVSIVVRSVLYIFPRLVCFDSSLSEIDISIAHDTFNRADPIISDAAPKSSKDQLEQMRLITSKLQHFVI
jgi:hypothetical protein